MSLTTVDYVNAAFQTMSDWMMDCPKVIKPVMVQLLKGKGKGTRARLVVETAKGLGVVTDEILEYAAGVELLHLAALVHDDVIDNAVFRRGVMTASAMFDKKTAVLCGDYLMTKCFKQLIKHNRGNINGFLEAVMHICLGEALQHEHCWNLDLTVPQYNRIIAGKTAALFSVSTYGAGALLNAGDKTCLRLFKAGYNIGMAFQMVDDCLDYESDAATIKKPVMNDLKDGVITYPLIYAFKKDPGLKNICGAKMRKSDVSFVYSRVSELGGVEAAKARAGVFSERAKIYINRAYMYDDNKTRGLLGIIDELAKRIS